jgi:hypothetical protein
MAKTERILTEAEALAAIRLIGLAYERELIRAWVTKKSLFTDLLTAGKEHVRAIRQMKRDSVSTLSAPSKTTGSKGPDADSNSGYRLLSTIGETCPPDWEECTDGSCAVSCELDI